MRPVAGLLWSVLMYFSNWLIGCAWIGGRRTSPKRFAPLPVSGTRCRTKSGPSTSAGARDASRRHHRPPSNSHYEQLLRPPSQRSVHITNLTSAPPYFISTDLLDFSFEPSALCVIGRSHGKLGRSLHGTRPVAARSVQVN